MTVMKQPPKFRYVAGYNPEFCRPTKDHLGAEIWWNSIELLNGDSKGELADGLKLNQLGKISCPIGPRKFNAMAGFNPTLAEYGVVSMNPVLEDGETLELVIKASKAFKLEDFDYIFKMWIVE
jgi:hypothetical protein